MKTYHLLVADPTPGHSISAKLVEDEVFHGDGEGNPENFFVQEAFESVEDKGTFDVAESVARLMGDVYTETDD